MATQGDIALAQKIYESEFMKGFSEGLQQFAKQREKQLDTARILNQSGRPRNDTMMARQAGNQEGGSMGPAEYEDGKGGLFGSIGSLFGPLGAAGGSLVDSLVGGDDRPRQRQQANMSNMLSPETFTTADETIRQMLSGQTASPYNYESEMSNALSSIAGATRDRSADLRGQLADMGMTQSGMAASAMGDLQQQGLQQQASVSEGLINALMQHRAQERSRALNALYQGSLAQNQAGQIGLQRDQMQQQEDDALWAALGQAASAYGYRENMPGNSNPPTVPTFSQGQAPPAQTQPGYQDPWRTNFTQDDLRLALRR